jgi:hypothetical protein
VLPPGSRGPRREPLLERVSDSDFVRERRRGYVMEEVLRELTETELASVAGGQTFNFTLNNQDSNQGIQVQKVSIVELIFYNRPTTSIVNVVNNSMNIGGP